MYRPPDLSNPNPLDWAGNPGAHMKMRNNEHKPGNMAVLVSAPATGLRTVEDAREAGAG